jgi:hypothetical protein
MKTYRESGPLIWCAAAATFEGRDQNSGLPRPKQRKKQIPPNETKLRERKWVWIFLFFSLFFFYFIFSVWTLGLWEKKGMGQWRLRRLVKVVEVWDGLGLREIKAMGGCD